MAGAGGIVVHATMATARTIQDDGFVGSDVLAKINNSAWSIWVPVAGTIAFLILIVVLSGTGRISERLARVVGVLVLVGGGAAYILPRLGGVSTAIGATLPVTSSAPVVVSPRWPALEHVLEEEDR